jgi:hypothetical protein
MAKMNTLRAFFVGVIEFRLTCTTNCGDHEEAYGWGREWAHRLTFRRFEPY